MTAAQRGKQHHGQREDVKQRQHANDTLDRIALQSRRPAPDIVDRHGGREIAVGKHGAFRQPGGSAGVLQQRDVVDADCRPGGRSGHAIDELPVGDDRGVARQRRLRRADLAPVVVLADDQPVDQSSVEKLKRGRKQRGEIAGDDDARAGIGELVRQRDLAIEWRQMRDARTGLQRAEEIDRMIRRVAEKQGDGLVLAVAGAEEGAGGDLDLVLQFGVADRPVAEFERGTRTELDGGVRQQIRKRAARDRLVPADAWWIELFAWMGHVAQQQEMSFRGARRTNPESRGSGFALRAPRNDVERAYPPIKPPSTARPATQRSCLHRRGA